MNQVHILVEGYAHPGNDDSYIASPTSTLIITDNGKKFIVDPGTNATKLLESLRKLNIDKDTVNGIYLSHYHPDHFLNIRLFPNIDILDGSIRWHDDEEYFYKDFLPDTNIQILPTPGHSPEDASLLVSTSDGIVCIAPDVFWWEDGRQKTDVLEDLLNHSDPFATDNTALLTSRKLVLSKADLIIPGHGKMFNNNFKKL